MLLLFVTFNTRLYMGVFSKWAAALLSLKLASCDVCVKNSSDPF